MLTNFEDTEESFVSAERRKTSSYDFTYFLELQLYGVYSISWSCILTDIL